MKGGAMPSRLVADVNGRDASIWLKGEGSWIRGI